MSGDPVVYLSFSSALSGTVDVAWPAREEVLAEYPDAEIRLVDTKAAAVAWRTSSPTGPKPPGR